MGRRIDKNRPPLRRPGRPKVEIPSDIGPRQVRRSLRCTQQHFADLIGVSIRVVQAWERVHWIRTAPGEVGDGGSMWKHRWRRPTGAARVLLAMVERDPWIVYT